MSSNFLVAVDNNDVSVVEHCIKTETPIAVKEAMIQACVTGKVDVARCIINSGVRELTYTEEYSPLCLATNSGCRSWNSSLKTLLWSFPTSTLP